ncbi:MAG: iron-sulfur cluster assembly scaffold protein [Solimonas sp.]
MFGYHAPIWQRFRAPLHGGRLEGAQVAEAQAGSPAARSVLRLQVEIDDGGAVRRARFQAYGCPTAIAVGEWLSERLESLAPAAWSAIDAAAIRIALEISDDKAHCALMGEDALCALTKQMSRPA